MNQADNNYYFNTNYCLFTPEMGAEMSSSRPRNFSKYVLSSMSMLIDSLLKIL